MLLDNEEFNGNVWECCCGNGLISKTLEQSNKFDLVISSDIQNEDYVYGFKGINFLHQEGWNGVINNIITNPPYNLAKEIILHSKTIANNKIAMLLRLQYLEGIRRFNNIFSDTNFQLEKIILPCDRIDTYRHSDIESGKYNINGYKQLSGMISYCWYIWNKQYDGGLPQIKLIGNFKNYDKKK